ncbi:MAG: extracellular solute-binding protein [Microgenomates group bacterium]|nr:extracellular solute-binding protein [Microgenomates group bacterium]
MDDNKTKPEENQPVPEQPTPIFEAVEESPPPSSEGDLKPEEISPDVTSPEDVSVPPADFESAPPPVYEDNKNRYLMFGAGIIVFFLIFFFILSLILKAFKTPQKEVKLVYWGLWEEKEIFDPLINQYQAEHKNIKIDYQKMSPDQYREKLIARSKNGQGPDIFRFHNTWLPEIKEIVSPLPESIMSKTEFEKTFYPIIQKDLKAGQYYYGLPLMIDGLVLIYNDSLFKKVGINSIPNTWEDIMDFAAKLTVKDQSGQLITSGIAIGTASNLEHFSDILGMMLVQNGADLKNLNTNEAAQALEAFRKFAEPPNNFWDESMPNSITAFIQEKVAMIFAPSWEILVIKNNNPDIDLKVAPVPAVPGTSPISLASYWVEGVSRYSKNQTEAWKFLKYLASKENLTKLYENESKYRLFGEPYPRVDLRELLMQNEYIGPVVKQAESYVSLPLSSRTFDNGINDNIIQYLENAVNSTIEGVSYSEALKTTKQGIDQIFAQYQIE